MKTKEDVKVTRWYQLGKQKGFTIVELLIVVVVIAVLAAITVIAYNGITRQARESTLKSDLSSFAKRLQADKVDSGSFPSSKPNYINSVLAYTGGGEVFCVSGAAGTKSFRVTEKGTVEEGVCAPAVAATMQSFTSAQCQALTVFDGTNQSATVNLADNRGGVTRTYTVGKLVDNNCWMLDNLKLGSTTGTITLTPSDSNVAANFVLPQLNDGTRPIDYTEDADAPFAYGPIAGDTGSGGTNYGYLYNFSVATAGTTRTTLPAGAGAAPSSLCPANWRLPTAGDASKDFNKLDIAFGGTGNHATSSPSMVKWRFAGPFRGAYSGAWSNGFNAQGLAVAFWSRSAYTSFDGNAFAMTVSDADIFPGGIANRASGFSLRCLMN